jgi:hypothetical protein
MYLHQLVELAKGESDNGLDGKAFMHHQWFPWLVLQAGVDFSSLILQLLPATGQRKAKKLAES